MNCNRGNFVNGIDFLFTVHYGISNIKKRSEKKKIFSSSMSFKDLFIVLCVLMNFRCYDLPNPARPGLAWSGSLSTISDPSTSHPSPEKDFMGDILYLI